MSTRFWNNTKTALLLGLIMGLAIGLGYLIGGGEPGWLVIGFLFGGLANVIAYFFSDKIAIASMRARQVTREDEPELVGMVERLAERAGIPTPRVYISPHQAPNAFATGRNPKHAAVCTTEGLLRLLDRRELEGVLAHEVAHIVNRDILISTVASTAAGALTMLAYLALFSGRDRDNPLGALGGLLMFIVAPIAAALIQMAISRSREYVADSRGAELVGDGMPLAMALEKLHLYSRRIPLPVDPSHSNMFIVQPLTGSGGFEQLFSTHPPVEKRIEALIGRPSTGMFPGF